VPETSFTCEYSEHGSLRSSYFFFFLVAGNRRRLLTKLQSLVWALSNSLLYVLPSADLAGEGSRRPVASAPCRRSPCSLLVVFAAVPPSMPRAATCSWLSSPRRPRSTSQLLHVVDFLDPQPLFRPRHARGVIVKLLAAYLAVPHAQQAVVLGLLSPCGSLASSAFYVLEQVWFGYIHKCGRKPEKNGFLCDCSRLWLALSSLSRVCA
jgi:hypothetical protein